MKMYVRKYAPRLTALGLTAALLVGSPPPAARAQFVVNDPLHMGVHISNFATQLKEWYDTVQNFSVIKDARNIAGVANTIHTQVKDLTGNIKDLTSAGLNLQMQIQNDLKKVRGLANLKLSNPVQLYSQVAGLMNGGSVTFGSFAALNALNTYAGNLQTSLENGKSTDINLVYKIFSDGQDSQSAQPTDYNQYEAEKASNFVAQYAYEEVADKKKIEMAFNYQKLADEMTQQSTEALAALNNDNRFSMTEGERMANISAQNANLMSAIKLRQEASRLLAEVAQGSPHKRAVASAFQEDLQTQAMIRLENKYFQQ
jgi:hypothetical protein